MLLGLPLRYAGGVVQLVDGELDPERREVHGLRGSVDGTLPEATCGTRVDFDLALVLRNSWRTALISSTLAAAAIQPASGLRLRHSPAQATAVSTAIAVLHPTTSSRRRRCIRRA